MKSRCFMGVMVLLGLLQIRQRVSHSKRLNYVRLQRFTSTRHGGLTVDSALQNQLANKPRNLCIEFEMTILLPRSATIKSCAFLTGEV
jgi:hypothetical protein